MKPHIITVKSPSNSTIKQESQPSKYAAKSRAKYLKEIYPPTHTITIRRPDGTEVQL